MQYSASPQASLSANKGTKELVPHIKISLEESTMRFLFLSTGVVDITRKKEKKRGEKRGKLFVAEGCLLSKMSDRWGQA